MKKIIRSVKGHREANLAILSAEIKDLEICYDSDKNAYHTFQKALYMAGLDSALHLEDDIKICDNFDSEIDKIVSSNPGVVHQFFSMRKADVTVGTRIEPGRIFLMAQCFYLPKGMSAEILEYSKKWNRDPTGSALDTMVADYLKSKNLNYIVHVPNLVDHLPYKSLIDSRRSTKRQSKTFITI